MSKGWPTDDAENYMRQIQEVALSRIVKMGEVLAAIENCRLHDPKFTDHFATIEAHVDAVKAALSDATTAGDMLHWNACIDSLNHMGAGFNKDKDEHAKHEHHREHDD